MENSTAKNKNKNTRTDASVSEVLWELDVWTEG